MADLSNKCSHLKQVVEKIRIENPILSENDLLKHLLNTFNIQKHLQDYIAEKKNLLKLSVENYIENQYNISNNAIDWLMNQSIAIQDEIQELYEALGGIKYKSAGWKWWKSGHKEFLNNNLKDFLTNEDKEELKFEIVDIYHFVVNIILLGEILADKNIERKICEDILLTSITVSFKPKKLYDEFNLTGKEALKIIKNFNKTFIKISNNINNDLNSVYIYTVGINILNHGIYLLKELIKLWESFKLPTLDIIYYYYAKNKENIDRQNRGY